MSTCYPLSLTSSCDSFSPRLDMAAERSEQEMNLIKNEYDPHGEEKLLHPYPSQSVSRTWKTCFIFSLAFILRAILGQELVQINSF
jgi:hypothetical protein